MKRAARVLALTACIAVLGAGLTACSSSATPAANPDCTEKALGATLEMIMHESEQAVDSLDSVTCSGDFALVQATISGGGSTQIGDQWIFEYSEGDWILKGPELVCGTFAPGAARPSDALVPEDLWEQACTRD